ncbi:MULTISPECIES: hypothetical protein [unclassified Leucobacter]|uniref:hypothetical protein n=2 Tax=Leucobacter TaxID=55968 RepID=UPI00165DBBA4|nr:MULTISPECIES: hypothetical protein [unclassified Leucobacter]MBC9936170.1 hypothetical protein [Leucobacter sp. cx-87]
MTDRGKHAMEPEIQEGSGASRPRRTLLWAGGAAAAALTVGALAWWNWPAPGVADVTILGVDYTTNMEVEEHGGYVYVTVPVNSDPRSVVVEVGNAGDDQEIREFLDGLDTLVPGEHVVELRASNLHFIVDGLAE